MHWVTVLEWGDLTSLLGDTHLMTFLLDSHGVREEVAWPEQRVQAFSVSESVCWTVSPHRLRREELLSSSHTGPDAVEASESRCGCCSLASIFLHLKGNYWSFVSLFAVFFWPGKASASCPCFSLCPLGSCSPEQYGHLHAPLF